MSGSLVMDDKQDLLPNIVPTQVPRGISKFDNAFIIEDDVGLNPIWPLRPNDFPYFFQCQCHDVFDM